MKSASEIEVKIRVPNRAIRIDRINKAGFVPSVARLFESNTLYDTADGALRQSATVLRLRQAGKNCVITWKGLGEVSTYKIRAELETAIGSLETMHRILEHLGYAPFFRYEKYRTVYARKASAREARDWNGRAGELVYDETPIGNYLELEGPKGWIDAVAAQLGYHRQDYLTASYVRLYYQRCAELGKKPGNMIFTSSRAKR